MKGLKFVGTSLDDLRCFTSEARQKAGRELRKVQSGLQPSDWKAMTAVGPGACEIRIHLEGAWRVIYVAKFNAVVYVLHVFQKKDNQTSLRDIRIAQQRYKEIGELP